MTIGDLKKRGVDRLQMLGFGMSCDLDVELLLSKVFSMEREMIIAHLSDQVTESQSKEFDALLLRREQHEPIAYILEKKAFFGHDFYVNADVLDPRPDSEVLVHAVLDMEKEVGEHKTFVEVGVGSGAIVLSLARQLAYGRFIGLEKSEKALAVAQRNLDESGLINVELNLSDYLETFQGKADYIIANLPYIPEFEMDMLPETVKNFEPREALVGGADGLDPYRFLLSQAMTKLEKGGWIFMEMDPSQIEHCKIVAIQYLGTTIEFRVYDDLSGKKRVLGVAYK